MKLNNISTIQEAKHYLKEEFIPKGNKKFAPKAKIEGEAYKPTPENLNNILCLKEKRKGYVDNTISYKGKRFQILPDPYRVSYFKAELDEYEHTEEEISILDKERRLKYIFREELEG